MSKRSSRAANIIDKYSKRFRKGEAGSEKTANQRTEKTEAEERVHEGKE